MDLAYFAFSVLAVAGAIGVVLEKNIIRAGFALVVCFGAVAGTYFTLSAPFVGASQILIYAVGITLVVVFALMLTSSKSNLESIKGETGKNFLSAIIALGIFFTFAFALVSNKWPSNLHAICPRNTEVIGLKLLSLYVLPFELISVLLLVALIGAVLIAKKDKKQE
ncbi:MAG: NADH-quinone oxidoreductase subunit J [Candidatus Melainabacteria bacterium]|nr:NADH-quinone oxidoreductase subunit J [Candidatus Melainabacteria bacterium]